MSKSKPNLIGIIFGVVFGLAGLIAIFVGQRSYAEGREAESWPTTSGQITSVDVRTQTERYEDNKGAYYTADVPVRVVRYRYEVGGRVLVGEQVDDIRKGTSHRTIPHAAGESVTIHYNPSTPQESLLDLPDRSKGPLVIAIMGGVFLLIGLLVPVLLSLMSRWAQSVGAARPPT